MAGRTAFMKAMLLGVGLLVAAAMLAPTFGGAAQAGLIAAPAAQPSPSPAAKPAAKPAGAAESSDPFAGINWSAILGGAGVVLIGLGFYAWYRSNRAEARPNVEQQDDIRRFVEDDFARYVAHGLTASAGAEAPSATEGAAEHPPRVSAANVAADEGWRKVFLHQLDLHHELHRFDKGIALSIYTQRIDAAVKRELVTLRATSPPVPREAGP